MKMSEKLRAIRKELNISQDKLARILDVSFPSVQSWENNRRNPYGKNKEAIEKMFKEVVKNLNRNGNE